MRLHFEDVGHWLDYMIQVTASMHRMVPAFAALSEIGEISSEGPRPRSSCWMVGLVVDSLSMAIEF